jgi:adenylate cyclase
MGAKITVTETGQAAIDVHIGNTASVGRTRDNTICLANCPQASRQHAVIRSHNAFQYQVMDLGSRNGTFVNGSRVVMPRTLISGDTIRIGSAELLFIQEAEMETDDFGGVTMEAAADSTFQTSQSVAILVCDIRGFSTMSEVLPEAEVARTLGKWFRESGKLIYASGGTIDKFIGDAVLAYWSTHPGSTTVDGEEHPAERPPNGGLPSSCDIALETGQRILKLAESMKWPGSDRPFHVGVALHFGSAICSNIGVMAERDATIIGDAVNTAFRLETVMKQVNKPLVLSGDFLDGLHDRNGFVDLGEHQLKGKSILVHVYSPS